MQTWVSENSLGGEKEHYQEIIPSTMTILTIFNDDKHKQQQDSECE